MAGEVSITVLVLVIITVSTQVSGSYVPVTKCTQLDPPEYGNVKIIGYRAVYRCNRGYRLYGDDYNSCHYGKWTGSTPTCKPIKCSDVEPPQYGKVVVKGYTHGSKAEYSCNHGYKLYGSDHNTCSYGRWTKWTPVCKPIPCPRLQIPKYGSVGVEGYTHGSKAKYSCSRGYQLYGEEYVKCDYGKWIGKVPICKPVKCPEPKALSYGSIDVKGYTHGYKAHFSCNHGYSLYGNRYITCVYGVWKGKLPQCKPIPCPKVGPPKYGSVDVKGYSHSSRAVYSCNHGYKLYGDGYITCDYGKWIGEKSICKPIPCPQVKPPKYGSVDVKGYSHKSRAVYSCNHGYKLYGDSYIICGYGKWKGTPPTCQPIPCPKVANPKYGSVDVKGYSHSSKAIYSCNHGYQLYGDGKITCDYGKWIGKTPICKPIRCPELKELGYGKIRVKGYTHGYKAYYSCVYGYKLYGDQYLTCDYGKWKGTPPTCKPIICTTPKAIEYGSAVTKKYVQGSKAEYSCNHGYRLYGYITCKYGVWKGMTPVCKPIPCPRVKGLKYGLVKVKGYSHGSRAEYTCKKGYALYGEDYITCDYGKWIGKAPVCKPIPCSKLKAPEYGSINVTGYAYGSKAIYSCDYGYYIYGMSYRKCVHGKWLGRIPICKIYKCGEPTAPKYGKVDVKGYKSGSRAVYSCIHGYNLHGVDYNVCEYGKWGKKTPICKPTPCPKLLPPKYGSVEVENYGHGSRAKYFCGHAYQLYGDQYLTCKYGKWIGTVPTCKPLHCPKVSPPEYGTVDVKGYGHDSRAIYSCNHGYKLYGDGYITCDYGKWIGEKSICKPIPCPKVKAPDYGTVVVKGYSHKSRAVYSCNHGYQLYGDGYITCDYGKWIGEKSICKPIPCPKVKAPDYGTVDVKGYSHKSRAVYSCNHGYKLYGDGYITCDYGKWIGEKSTCKPIPCPKVKAPDYGSVDVKGSSHSSKAIYSCNHGYQLYGDGYITCDYGKWIGEKSICKPIPCPKVKAPDYGTVVVKGYSHKSRAVYSCNHGYKLHGDGYIICDYGKWIGEKSICKPIPCPKVKAPDYGSVDVKGYSHSSRAVYSCNHGYKLYGDGYITCDYGKWIGEKSICKPIPCPKVKAPDYGTVDVKGYSHKSRAVYSCNHGYKLHGDGYITCDYGKWIGEKSICKPIPCPKVKAPDYGFVDVKGYSHSSRAVYSCNHGYKLYGDGYITCDYGKWIGKKPICKPIPCPKLSAPEYGSVDVKGYSHSSKAIYSCNHGYQLYGDGKITCDYGKWIGKKPICKPIKCPSTRAPEYGSIDIKGYTSGSKAHYSCNDGYQLYGDSYITCQYGKWVGTAPVCKPKIVKKCPYPPAPNYGSVKVTGWRSTPQAWYICTRGYSLQGQESRICENGKWLGEAPICKKTHY